MIDIKNKSACSGCWACSNICPKRCIVMTMDSEGFHYPVINNKVCIDCGLCEQVCPNIRDITDDDIPKGFVVQQKDVEILRRSTSGGFFSALSRWVVANKGVVFGAAFDENMVLRHQYADSLSACERFRGSKYLQSVIGNSYNSAKEFLENGRIVAFSGTPCQIAGLMGFLKGRTYPNLITVDVVCHGVPSPLLFKKYLTYYSDEYHTSVTDYLSRDKHYSYLYSTASLFFKNGKTLHKGKESDFMLNLYFSNLVSRPSCYACHFKTLKRVSDITIFDCWDAKSVSSLFSEKGATNVFIHSQRGVDVLEQLSKDLIIVPSDNKFNQILKRDGVMIKNRVPLNPKRNEFFEDLENLKFVDLQNKWMPLTLKRRLISLLKPFLFKIGIFDIYMKLKE